MPAALQLDWSGIKTAATSGISLRTLAAKFGVPYGTLAARSKREGWHRKVRELRAELATDQRNSEESGTLATVQPRAIMASDVVAEALAHDSSSIKLAASRNLKRAIESLDELDPGEVLGQSRNIKDALQSSALVHGWQSAASGVSINVLSQNTVIAVDE